MFCIKCGKQIPDGANFCNHCGSQQNGNGQNSDTKSGCGWRVFQWGLFLMLVIAAFVLFDSRSQADKPFGNKDIPAQWAAENRYLPDGGSCGVLETLSQVKDCKSVDLVLWGEGLHGTSVKGNWEVHFRIGGNWEKLGTVSYCGSGEETFTITFDSPTTFDAVCAFPTQRGNYSYQSYYILRNATY